MDDLGGKPPIFGNLHIYIYSIHSSFDPFIFRNQKHLRSGARSGGPSFRKAPGIQAEAWSNPLRRNWRGKNSTRPWEDGDGIVVVEDGWLVMGFLLHFFFLTYHHCYQYALIMYCFLFSLRRLLLAFIVLAVMMA